MSRKIEAKKYCIQKNLGKKIDPKNFSSKKVKKIVEPTFKIWSKFSQ